MAERETTDERLDRVGIHLHNAMQDLAGDVSQDAQSVRLLLEVTRHRLENIRRRQSQARVGRWLGQRKIVGLRAVQEDR